MYDYTEFRILEQIYLNPGIHKRELSKRLKLGMPSIGYGLQKINKFILKQKAGNQIHYFLDYTKEGLSPALCSVEYSRFERLPVKVRLAVRDFLKALPEKPLLALLFGSSIHGTFTMHSDIDILLVFQKMGNAQEIEHTAKRISMKINIPLNPVYLGYKEFKESFHNPTKEFFKKLKKDKIILVGVEWWRQLQDEEA